MKRYLLDTNICVFYLRNKAGIASVHHNMVMVTNNTRHFHTIHGIVLEDWVKR
jgi:predicted nucleic acid-binding protein